MGADKDSLVWAVQTIRCLHSLPPHPPPPSLPNPYTRGAQPICQQLVHYADAPHKHLSIHLIHLLLSQSVSHILIG